MRSNIKSTVLALFAGVLYILPSCKKQEGVIHEKTDILTSGSWRLTAFTVYGMMGTEDVYASYRSCQKDDLLTFNKNGTAEIDEGPSKCDPANPQAYSYQWRFLNGNTSRINIDGTEYIVDQLENNEFRISTPHNGYDSQSVLVYAR